MQYCNTCEEHARFYCHGCKQIFCQYHADEHRQSLYDQLDWLTVDHDDLIGTLDYSSAIKQMGHQSKTIIDKWEEESITYIRKTASEARLTLMDAIQTHINDIKERLRTLTDKFNALSDENNNTLFDERNLKQWAMELRNLKSDFLTSPPFTVRVHGNKPVVMPIIKIQPETIYESPPIEKQQQQLDSFGLEPIKHLIIPPELPQNNTKKKKSITDTSINHDRFSFSSNHVKILDNGRLILHDSTKSDASIRGLQEYSRGEHQLFFRIEHMTSNQWIFFGIISKHASFDQRAHLNISAYGWTGYNNVYINGKSMPVLNGYLSDMKENDFVELIIDCNNQTIILWHSRQTYKTKLSIDIRTCPFPWQFLISCHTAHDSVRILPLSMSSMIKREQEQLNNDMKIKEINLKNNIHSKIDTMDTVR